MQKVLFDRVHGYWSALASSQLQPDELEPARSERLVRGNVSPFAALVAARQFCELDVRRSAVHERFIAQTEAVSGGQHTAKVDARGRNLAAAVAEGYEQAGDAGAAHRERKTWSDTGDICAEFLNVLPDNFIGRPSAPRIALQSESISSACAPQHQVPKHGSVGPFSCMSQQTNRLAMQDSRGRLLMRQRAEDNDTRAAVAEAKVQGTVRNTAPLNVATPAEQQTSEAASGALPACWSNNATSEAGDGAAGSRKSALLSIHSKLRKNNTIPRSALLALPAETELDEGWTVADEVELAAAGTEFMDRFGELPTRSLVLQHCSTLSGKLLDCLMEQFADYW